MRERTYRYRFRTMHLIVYIMSIFCNLVDCHLNYNTLLCRVQACDNAEYIVAKQQQRNHERFMLKMFNK